MSRMTLRERGGIGSHVGSQSHSWWPHAARRFEGIKPNAVAAWDPAGLLSNIQQPKTKDWDSVVHWMFGVGCWVFDVPTVHGKPPFALAHALGP
jgi:hypothetical protein